MPRKQRWKTKQRWNEEHANNIYQVITVYETTKQQRVRSFSCGGMFGNIYSERLSLKLNLIFFGKIVLVHSYIRMIVFPLLIASASDPRLVRWCADCYDINSHCRCIRTRAGLSVTYWYWCRQLVRGGWEIPENRIDESPENRVDESQPAVVVEPASANSQGVSSF